MHVLCPGCQKQVHWDIQQPWRPFCSQRCKMIDLGAWAAEEHRLPVNHTTSILDQQDDQASEFTATDHE